MCVLPFWSLQFAWGGETQDIPIQQEVGVGRSRNGLHSVAERTEGGSHQLPKTQVMLRSCQRESQNRRLGSQQPDEHGSAMFFFSWPFCTCSGHQKMTEGQIWNAWCMSVCLQERDGEGKATYTVWPFSTCSEVRGLHFVALDPELLALLFASIRCLQVISRK